jgi:hypothetical protein
LCVSELSQNRWEELFEREGARYDDGMLRLRPEQLVRLGNAAYGAGLSLSMLGREAEAREWFRRAAARWRESFEHADPDAWGRPIGVLKALILARDETAADAARWALDLGAAAAPSPIGRYAATLAYLVLGQDDEAAVLAGTLTDPEFPPAVAGALAAIAARSEVEYVPAAAAVLESFETRDSYLEDIPVADTVIVLQELANAHGVDIALRNSALLPGQE